MDAQEAEATDGIRQGALRVETLNTPVRRASQGRSSPAKRAPPSTHESREARHWVGRNSILAIELWELLLEFGDFGQIVDPDVRAILVMLQVVLVVALGGIERL